jgi:VCBS repeat-containing protein
MARIIGTSAAQRLTGGSGNDSIAGLGGADTIEGGAGDDTVDFRSLPDLLLPGRIVAGGQGTDTLRLLFGGDIGDAAFAGIGGMERLVLAGNAPTSLALGGLAAAAFGASITVSVAGTLSSLDVDGSGIGAGTALHVRGSSGADHLRGGAGGDRLEGRGGADTMDGGGGNDTLLAGDGADSLLGGAGQDSLAGQGGADTLDGAEGNDTLLGGDGADSLIGGAGGDLLNGGAGTDTAWFEFARAAYTVTLRANGGALVRLNGSGETDALRAVERLAFGDGTLVLLAPNLAPVARDDVALVQDGAALIHVLANDTDPDADPLRLALVDGQDGQTVTGRFGTLLWSADGVARFTADPASGAFAELAAGEAGEELFRLTVSDGLPGGEADSWLSFTLVGVNDAPEAQAVTLAAGYGAAATGRLLADDVDSDDDAETLDYVLLTPLDAAQGVLTLGTGGRFGFTAGEGFAGLLRGESAAFTVTWQAVDRHGAASAARSLDITVAGTKPAAPTITGIAEDTGIPGDSVTADPTPLVSGTATPGDLVEVFLQRPGGTDLLGSALADTAGLWSFPVESLPDGDYAFTARARSGDRVSELSAPYALTVDAAAPATGFFLAAPAAMPTVTGTPYRLLAADMNGDGRPDFVTATADVDDIFRTLGNVHVNVELNDGHGGTVRTARISVPDYPIQEIRIGDMNGDGALDVVIARRVPGKLSILYGDGAGGLSAPVDVLASPLIDPVWGGEMHTGMFDLADMDRDGRLDIVVRAGRTEYPDLDWNPGLYAVVLHNAGGGSFVPTSYRPSGTVVEGPIRVGQFGGNSAPDILLRDENARVVLNAGDGTLVYNTLSDAANRLKLGLSFSTQAIPNKVPPIELADFDGDGLTDFVAAGPNFPIPADALVVSARFDWNWAVQTPGTVPYRWSGSSATAGDINGDGFADLAVAGTHIVGYQDSSTLSRIFGDYLLLSLGRGDGTFDAPLSIPLDRFPPFGDAPRSIVFSDMDGDGRADLVFLSKDGLVQLVRNTSTGIVGIGPDTGLSPTDGITALPVTTVRGFSEPGSAVAILAGGAVIGNGTADAATGAFLVTLDAPLGAGSHALTLVATDMAGNVSAPSPAYRVVVDQQVAAPVIGPIDADLGRFPDDRATNGRVLDVIGTAEAGARVELFVDGARVSVDTATPQGGYTLAGVRAFDADGTYTLLVRATDRAGNQADSAPVTVIIDRTPPAAPVLVGIGPDRGRDPADLLTDRPITTVHGLAEAGSLVALYAGLPYMVQDRAAPGGYRLERGDPIGTALASADGSFTVTLATPLAAERIHVLAATATDLAGNVSALSAELRAALDQTAPDFAPGYTRVQSEATASPVQRILVAELHGDGRPDILAGTSTEGARLLSGGVEGLFTAPDRPLLVAPEPPPPDPDPGDITDPEIGTPPLDPRAPAPGAPPPAGTAGPVLTLGRALDIAVADLTGDGERDMLVLSDFAGASSFYLQTGLGDGRFGAPLAQTDPLLAALPYGALHFTLAEVTGDGRADAVTIARDEIRVVPGLAGGGFGPSTLLASGTGLLTPDMAAYGFDLGTVLAFVGLTALATGDVTGDGVTDIVVTLDGLQNYLDILLPFDSRVLVLAGLGDGGFAAPSHASIPGAPVALALGDLDGDGREDAVVATLGLPDAPAPQVSVLLSGPGGLAAPVSVALPSAPSGLAIGDLDGDGHLDVAAALPGTGVVLLRGDGQGGLAAPVAVPGTAGAIDIALADVNGDGRPDLVVGTADGVTVLHADASGIELGRMLGGVPVVQGRAEPFAGLALYDGAMLLGTGQAGADGSFSIALAAPLGAGGDPHALSLVATDRAGNVSLPSPAFAVSLPAALTAPRITATLTDADPAEPGGATLGPVTELRGTADPGAYVAILLDGVEVGGATARPDGSFALRLATPLAAEGSYLFEARASDLAGRETPGTAPVAVVIDRTAPAAPVLGGIDPDTGFYADDAVTALPVTEVHGTAEPGSLVTLYLGLPRQVAPGQDAREVIGSAVADAAGDFMVTLAQPLGVDGRYLFTATATDAAGNVSAEAAPLVATVDRTPPEIAPNLFASSPTQVDLAPGQVAGDMAFGDLDGDGQLDLVLATVAGLEVRLGAGDGRFGPGARLLPANGLVSVAAGDVDGDGFADVAAVTEAGSLLLFEGRPGGVPAWPQALVGTGLAAVQRVLATDLTGDGRADLLLLGTLPGGVGEALTLLAAKADGTGFLAPQLLFEAADIRDFIVFDLGTPDRGGGLDLATGEFIADPVLPDGVQDLAVLDGAGNVTLLSGRPNDARGWIAEASDLVISSPGAVALAAGEINGGAPDLVLAGADGLRLFLADLEGGYLGGGALSPGGADSLALADLDGDGRLDLFAGVASQGAVAVRLALPGGGFGALHFVASGSTEQRLFVRDLNGDAVPDVAGAGDGGPSLWLMLWNPPGITDAASQDGTTLVQGRFEPGALVEFFADFFPSPSGVPVGSGWADPVTGAFDATVTLPAGPAPTTLIMHVTDLAGNSVQMPADELLHF